MWGGGGDRYGGVGMGWNNCSRCGSRVTILFVSTKTGSIAVTKSTSLRQHCPRFCDDKINFAAITLPPGFATTKSTSHDNTASRCCSDKINFPATKSASRFCSDKINFPATKSASRFCSDKINFPATKSAFRFCSDKINFAATTLLPSFTVTKSTSQVQHYARCRRC